MSNNKQSSVDWLAEQLKAKMQMWNSTKNYQEFHIVLEAGEFGNLVEQAKAMHREEIIYSVEVGYTNGYLNKEYDGHQHYNETFGA